MKTILAVDDSSAMRKMISFVLSTAGFNVTEAVDGKDGLEKSKTNKFDLIISDIHMPNMNGIDLTKALRAESDYQNTPILLLTTESGKELKAEGLDSMVSGWITKPFNPPQLIEEVSSIFN